MNQRIAVRTLVRKDDEILLLRRANGRDSILEKYELPGGRVDYEEQPEETARRYLKQDVNLTIKTVKLLDVVTYTDHDDRNIQYAIVVYSTSFSSYEKVKLNQNYDKYVWKKMSDIHQYDLTESTKVILGVTLQLAVSLQKTTLSTQGSVAKDQTSHLIIYSDGGSRGNPGPSASGFIIMNEKEEVIHQGGMYLGITTNNQAEYHAVRLGLEKAHAMGATTVDFRLDSMLVVNQLNGLYTIKNRELWPINERIKELLKKFTKVNFRHVRREFNQLADGMVNKILNAHAEENKVQ